MAREEQLQRESEVYAWTANQFDIQLAFKKGAEWEHKRLIEKACELLCDNFYEHPHEQYLICSEAFDCIEEMVEEFMKAMKE